MTGSDAAQCGVLRLLRALALVPALAIAATAQQEQLQVDQPEPGTIRLGDTARAAIRIEGRSADPREPKLPKVDGLVLRLSPPSRSSYTFYDGRELIERVGVQYVLELVPQRAGSFVVPPFSLWTGTREQSTPELRLEVRQDLAGAELGFLEVTVEPRRVYVHEPVRIAVDYGVLQGVRLVQDFYNRYRYLDIEVQAAWLNEFPGGERIELPAPSGDTRVVVCNRQLLQARYDGDHVHAGQRYQKFSFDRAFLPTRLGRIELPAPLLRFQVLRREGQQDLFGRARGALSENLYVYGKPITLEVLPIPEEGRPTPYYGAVGRFTIDAALDKDHVKVGDSVKLTLTVRGQGNFEFLRLPSLDDLPGFHKLGEAEAQRSADRVVTTYDLTPLSADVKEIPAIGWNYFDTTPGVAKFVAVRTPALPLFVAPLADGETLLPLPDGEARAVTPGVDDVFDLPEFDGPPVVVQRPAAFWGWLAALGPWLAVGVAFVAFGAVRRRRADVKGQRARGARRACEAALRRGEDPLDALCGYLADRLDVPAAAVIAPDLAERLTSAGLDGERAAEVAAAIERATAQRYGGGAAFAAADVEALVARLDGQRFGVRGWLPLLLLPALLLGAAPARAAAQAPAATAAIAAYRAGDYAAADREFATAYAATGDRRMLRARGNCLYRLGDLPRALWAFESARLGLPRDDELSANLRLVRQRLELAEPAEGFVHELRALTARLSPVERLVACALAMTLAALCLVFGWRRVGWRWVGVLLAAPGVWFAVEAWLAADRGVRAVAVEPLQLVAEPRQDLPPVATVRPGVVVTLPGRGEGAFVRVRAGDREGYAPSAAVAVIE